jgi:hypothetical protein
LIGKIHSKKYAPLSIFLSWFYPYIRHLNIDKESTEDNAVAVENKTDTFIYIEPRG